MINALYLLKLKIQFYLTFFISYHFPFVCWITEHSFVGDTDRGFVCHFIYLNPFPLKKAIFRQKDIIVGC